MPNYGIITLDETNGKRGVLLLNAIGNTHNFKLWAKRSLSGGLTSRHSSRQRWLPGRGRFSIMAAKKWTKTEEEFVKANFETMTYKEIGLILDRSAVSIGQYCKKLGLKKNQGGLWTDEQRHFVEGNYLTMTYEEIGKRIGRDLASVRNYCYLNGLEKTRKWQPDEIEVLRQWYEDHPTGELDGLVTKLNRTKPEISLQARRMGLSDKHRPPSENERKLRSEISKRTYQRIGYRGGIKGKKHKPETIAILRQRTLDLQNNQEYKKKHSKAVSMGIRAGIRNGTFKAGGSNPYSRTKSGKREDLGNIFFRSAWEANYARYLNWLVSVGEIKEWKYEVDTFEFHRIRKGTRFYTPDFKVFENDGSIAYHEVKGWMDDKSKTKLKRMAKYYPEVKLIIIDEPAYYAIAKQVKNLVPNWE